MDFKDTLRKILSAIGVSLANNAGLKGIKGYIVSLFVKIIVKVIVATGVRIREKALAEKKLKEYNEKLKNPNLTVEERLKADRDFLGDG